MAYIRSVSFALVVAAVASAFMLAGSSPLNDQEAPPQLLTNQSADPTHPVQLIIPRLNIDAAVEHVGLDAVGQMAVPSHAEDVAWYQPGTVPGQAGNAVISGHLDSATGPAVFFELASLTPGDEITVVSNAGATISFIVERVVTYPRFAIPLATIFGPTADKRLTLVTCGGQFNNKSQLYSHRTVVYTTAR